MIGELDASGKKKQSRRAVAQLRGSGKGWWGRRVAAFAEGDRVEAGSRGGEEMV
jgi:hypothetical protein